MCLPPTYRDQYGGRAVDSEQVALRSLDSVQQLAGLRNAEAFPLGILCSLHCGPHIHTASKLISCNATKRLKQVSSGSVGVLTFKCVVAMINGGESSVGLPPIPAGDSNSQTRMRATWFCAFIRESSSSSSLPLLPFLDEATVLALASLLVVLGSSFRSRSSSLSTSISVLDKVYVIVYRIVWMGSR